MKPNHDNKPQGPTGDCAEWDEPNKARLYAAIHEKMGRIRDQCSPAKGSEGFFLANEMYHDSLESLGISRVRFRRTRKVPPHWADDQNRPVDHGSEIVIPDPFFALYGSTKPHNNGEENRGLCVPIETAQKILLLGVP